MREIEAILLTGGASTRMGQDKASLVVRGVPLAELVAGRLLAEGYSVTVMGRKPLPRCAFVQDVHAQAGPLAALVDHKPTAPWVFVAACDLPLFDARIVTLLHSLIGPAQAAVPNIGGRLQPLVALYSASAFTVASECVSRGQRSMLAWLDALSVVRVEEGDLLAGEIPLESLSNVNRPCELERLIEP
ncbi:MAG: molybdenum cofactor guanylyltransferase [Fimbriimonadaceae bacterium]